MTETKRRIIDAHHHLWDLAEVSYPWLKARGVTRFFGDPTAIQQNYLVEDLRCDADDYELLASVHIQVGAADGEEFHETEWLQRCADAQNLPNAIVAFCDLSHPDAPEALQGQRAFAAVRGIRQIVGRSEGEDVKTGIDGLLSDDTWRQNLALLAELGLSFDLQLIPRQVPAIADILGSMPDLKVALCHCGSPWDQTVAGLGSWRTGLQALAALPSVHCKISGLGMFNHDWSVASIRTIVESCIDIFGPARCMFGSNFPVDKLHGSYRQVWSAFEEIAAQYSQAERERLFMGTAAEFYAIEC